jgi:Na+-driven multidrug efflux pump
MDLGIALIVYLVLLITIFLFFLYLNYTVFSSFMLALIVCLIYLNIAFPITRTELDSINSLTILYIFIQIFTVVAFATYTLVTTITESRNEKRFPMRYNNV